MPLSTARMATKGSGTQRPHVRRRTQTRSWDPDEVAAHLMGCQRQIVRGLARKAPWAGLDDDTLTSCFGHGAAVIARVASSGQRPEWRTTKDLERAQVAAFRHQVLDHWKRANAQSRQGDRFAVAFDPERHASGETPMDRLFEQPDLLAIERDLLAELADDRLREFWRLVLREELSFKDAGQRLDLTKAQVMAATRAGRSSFADYLERRATGQLCAERSQDVLADRAGTATPLRTERARAHLESCYVCALVHEPGTSAFQRGLLGLAPTGVILRLLFRSTEQPPASPVLRAAVETGSSSKVVAAGLAAVAVAGSGVGIQAVKDAPATPPPAREAVGASQAPKVRSISTATLAVRTPVNPPPVVEPLDAPAPPRAKPVPKKRPVPKPTRTAPTREEPPATPPPTPATPAPTEFGFEQQAAEATPPPVAPRAPAPAAPAPASPPATPNEFDLP